MTRRRVRRGGDRWLSGSLRGESVEARLSRWGERLKPAERTFLAAVRSAAAEGVWYGRMREIVGWEWEARQPFTAPGRVVEHWLRQLFEAMAASPASVAGYRIRRRARRTK